jgi:hypothetical protein
MIGERRIINRRTGEARRVNAPIRRTKEGGTLPDVLVGLAFVAWTMAVIFGIASFLTDSFTAGDAGRTLERIFAVALGFVGLLLFALAVLLLDENRGRGDHYLVPMMVGMGVGAAEALLFLAPAPGLLWLPPLFLVFTLRPLRRAIEAPFHRTARR